MSVNQKKTQLLAISASSTEDVTTFIRMPDGTVTMSQPTLKILGFVFGSRPSVQPHLDHICMKFRARVWIIRHLKQAKIGPECLKKLYKVLVLPVLDYGAVIYHSLLNKEQCEYLEKLQRNVMKIIFGFKLTHRELDKKSDIETLWSRRERLVDKFLDKTRQNERFSPTWFPQKSFYHMDLRHELIYEEKFAKTERLYKSPKYFMRRRLNGGLT